MRVMKMLAVLAVFVMVVGAVSVAKTNQYGVSDLRTVTFTGPVWVGEVLLPEGEYDVRHTMDGANHVMVFRKVASFKKMEAKVNCTLVPLTEPATKSERMYTTNTAKELVLTEMVFKGDKAKHVFVAEKALNR